MAALEHQREPVDVDARVASDSTSPCGAGDTAQDVAGTVSTGTSTAAPDTTAHAPVPGTKRRVVLEVADRQVAVIEDGARTDLAGALMLSAFGAAPAWLLLAQAVQACLDDHPTVSGADVLGLVAATPQVKKDLIATPSTGAPWMWEVLAVMPRLKAEDRMAALAHAPTPTRALHLLLDDPRHGTRLAAAQRLPANDAKVAALATGDESLRRLMCTRWDTPADVLVALAPHLDEWEARNVLGSHTHRMATGRDVGHPSVNDDVLLALLNHPDEPAVRALAAIDRRLPKSALAAIAHGTQPTRGACPETQEAIATRPDLPPAVVRVLAEQAPHTHPRIAQKPEWVRGKVLQALLAVGDRDAMAALLAWTDHRLPPEHLVALLDDDRVSWRAAFALPDDHPGVLAAALRHRQEPLVRAALRSRRLSVTDLHALLATTNPDQPFVAAAVAEHDNADASVVAAAAQATTDTDVLARISEHRLAPLAVLAAAARGDYGQRAQLDLLHRDDLTTDLVATLITADPDLAPEVIYGRDLPTDVLLAAAQGRYGRPAQLAVLDRDDEDLPEAVVAALATHLRGKRARLVAQRQAPEALLVDASTGTLGPSAQKAAVARADDDLPDTVLCALAEHAPSAREDLVYREHLPASLIDALVVHAPEHHALLLESRGDLLTTEHLTAMSTSTDPDVRAALAEHPRTPAAVLVDLAVTAARHGDSADLVLQALGNRADLPAAALGPVLDGHGDAHPTALRHHLRALTTAQVRSLVADDRYSIRALVAAHPDAPAAVIDDLARDTSPTVRTAVVGRDDLTESQARALLAHDRRSPHVEGVLRQRFAHLLTAPVAPRGGTPTPTRRRSAADSLTPTQRQSERPRTTGDARPQRAPSPAASHPADRAGGPGPQPSAAGPAPARPSAARPAPAPATSSSSSAPHPPRGSADRTTSPDATSAAASASTHPRLGEIGTPAALSAAQGRTPSRPGDVPTGPPADVPPPAARQGQPPRPGPTTGPEAQHLQRPGGVAAPPAPGERAARLSRRAGIASLVLFGLVIVVGVLDGVTGLPVSALGGLLLVGLQVSVPTWLIAKVVAALRGR